MRVDELPDYRPQHVGVRLKTAHNYDRCLFQIYADLGYQLPPRKIVNAKRENGGLVGLLPWEVEPPDWPAILKWRDSRAKESLGEHRRALVWLAGYWGQGEKDLPYFLVHTWATKAAMHLAQQRGDMEVYERFLHLPDHMTKILGASPFERKLLSSKMKGSRKLLRTARYKDKLWRSICFALFYTGARISEVTTLTLGMYRPEQSGIMGWPQPKKGFAPRDIILPKEPWLWHSRADPSFDWYLKYVRPRVAKSANPEDPFWINTRGEPIPETTARNLVGEGVRRALRGESRGSHSFRRGCATWRYHCGWDLEEIALLLDDRVAVVEASYIDWNWLKVAGRTQERSVSRTPPVKLIRSRALQKRFESRSDG